MKYTIPKMKADNFDWMAWRRGADIWIKLGFHARYHSIIDGASILRQYAIGYIPGDRLFCRPEPNEIAVMFAIDNVEGWTHLRKQEFEEVFRVR